MIKRTKAKHAKSPVASASCPVTQLARGLRVISHRCVVTEFCNMFRPSNKVCTQQWYRQTYGQNYYSMKLACKYNASCIRFKYHSRTFHEHLELT